MKLFLMLMNVMAGFPVVSSWTSVEDMEVSIAYTQQPDFPRLEEHDRHQ